jgi:hypothetical protein
MHAEVKGEYGCPKMWKELVARGHRVGKERIRRLMQFEKSWGAAQLLKAA